MGPRSWVAPARCYGSGARGTRTDRVRRAHADTDAGGNTGFAHSAHGKIDTRGFRGRHRRPVVDRCDRGSDASAALISFVATVPDGSTIVFKAGGVYRLDRALKLSSRHNLTFEGNGATLKAAGTGTTESNNL